MEMYLYKVEIYYLLIVEEKLMWLEKDVEFFLEKRLKENESRKLVKFEKNFFNFFFNSSDGINYNCL